MSKKDASDNAFFGNMTEFGRTVSDEAFDALGDEARRDRILRSNVELEKTQKKCKLAQNQIKELEVKLKHAKMRNPYYNERSPETLNLEEAKKLHGLVLKSREQRDQLIDRINGMFDYRKRYHASLLDGLFDKLRDEQAKHKDVQVDGEPGWKELNLPAQLLTDEPEQEANP